MGASHLGWLGIIRLGLVQASMGAIVVLATSTMNRVMVVELALPAALPGALVAIHHAMGLLRPRLGYGSDMGGRRTPWILGGIAVLGLGGTIAAAAIAWMETNLAAGVALAVAGFVMIGLGAGSCGTNLLVLLAKRVDARRRPAAAAIVWIMLIAGFVVTAITAGILLDPYSHGRLVAVTAGIATASLLIAWLALGNLEGRAQPAPAPAAAGAGPDDEPKPTFRQALAQVWAEPQARRFSIFVFVSMLAYSAQDLILEPFAGTVFGLTPGESTSLAGIQNGGALLGMLLAGLLGSGFGRPGLGSMRLWTIGGCLASALALFGLSGAGVVGPPWPLSLSVFALGLANGAYAVAAIGSMMGLADSGRAAREGVRMGLWGAAQAVAMGTGGFLGAAAVDLARNFLGSPATAYVTVFALQGVLFLFSAVLAARVGTVRAEPAGRELDYAAGRTEGV